MQGLVNFTGELGYIIAVLLPTFCYVASLACFLFAGWGFWMQARPDNPFRGKPWIPAVSLILSGAFASFDKILNMANASAGTAVQVSIGALTSYTPPNAANFTQGNTPGTLWAMWSRCFRDFSNHSGLWPVSSRLWRGDLWSMGDAIAARAGASSSSSLA